MTLLDPSLSRHILIPPAEGERQLRDLLRSLPVAAYTADPDGHIRFYNEAAAALWGRHPVADRDRWCGSWRLFSADGTPLPHEQCAMALAIKETRAVVGMEAVAERPDGTRVPFVSFPSPLLKEGVIFLDMDSGLRLHEQLVKEHFATVIPAADNKFSALNSAVWSGGSFIWVPPGVRVEIPLQAYFRINAQNMGQFERTLIIAEPGSFVHYIEGCTAPTYTSDSLHSAVVELIAKPGAHIRYTTIQNWSKNVYNLVTKRAVAHEDAKVEWVDGNLGSKLTMKYPSIYLLGKRAHGEVLSIAFAGEDQHQDAGAKMVHAAPDTTSIIVSKSISKNGGRTSYRGLIKVYPDATGVKSSVKCDALLMDEKSRSDTYPTMEIDEKDVTIEHEATVSKVGEEQLFYLMSRGLTQDEATAMIVNGFFEPFTKELPLEYAVELNRLIQLEMSGSVG